MAEYIQYTEFVTSLTMYKTVNHSGVENVPLKHINYNPFFVVVWSLYKPDLL